MNINRTTERPRGRTTTQPIGWRDAYGHPTVDQVTDPESLFHVPVDNQRDYWAMAADPAIVTSLVRRAGCDREHGNRIVEVSDWAHRHGLVPEIDTRYESMPTQDTVAVNTLTMVQRDHGITEMGLVEHIVTAREAADRVSRRAKASVARGDWDNRHRCTCCGTVDGTTRRRMRSAPLFPGTTPTAVLTDMLCEPCYGQAVMILTEQAGNRSTVAAWLKQQA